jgi:beta-xylosidase
MNLQVTRSNDLSRWSPVVEALPRLPRWAAAVPGTTWAPAVLPRPGGFVLFYTARDAASGFQCISRATSLRPEGPYVDTSTRPFVCQVAEGMCGSIDASPFVDGDGAAYLVWKSDENSAACRTPPRIWSQRLADDGLSLVGPRARLLTKDLGWEGTIIEGPAMLREEGRYYLFYSANDYESDRYSVGYATCAGPVGPCTKSPGDGPWLRSHGAERGPGGEEFFTRGGETWMAYHGWTGPKTTYAAGGARSLRLARVVFDGDGPHIAS